MNEERIAVELVKIAKELSSANSLLKAINVNADKHLKKEHKNIEHEFENMRFALEEYEEGKGTAADAKDSVYGVTNILEKVAGNYKLVAKTLKNALFNKIDKMEEAKDE